MALVSLWHSLMTYKLTVLTRFYFVDSVSFVMLLCGAQRRYYHRTLGFVALVSRVPCYVLSFVALAPKGAVAWLWCERSEQYSLTLGFVPSVSEACCLLCVACNACFCASVSEQYSPNTRSCASEASCVFCAERNSVKPKVSRSGAELCPEGAFVWKTLVPVPEGGQKYGPRK